jgi:hypothetical protein
MGAQRRRGVTACSMANKTRERTRRWRACGVEGSGTCKDNGHGSMASSQTTAGHTAARRGQETTAGTQGPTRAHKAPASLARRPNATTRGGWRGSPPIQRSSGKTAAKKVRWSRGRRLGRLGLMQGKQSSTTPSPAGPAPIPWWRLDHGRLRLGRRRPWFGLLRLRSAHTRADGDEVVRLQPPPRTALPRRLQLLPSSSPSSFLIQVVVADWGKIPQGRRGLGRGRRTGFIGRRPRVLSAGAGGWDPSACVPMATRRHPGAQVSMEQGATGFFARRACVSRRKKGREERGRGG